MKNKFNFFLLVLGVLTSLFVVSCQTEDAASYDGDAKIHFINESADAFVVSGTNYTDYVVDFGSLNTVSGNKQVKLVVDGAKSNAVQGVDYQILNNTSEIPAGSSRGKFTVRLFEAGMSQTAKHVVFNLQSSDISGASFKQEMTLNMSLTCPISYFVGQFELTQGYWQPTGNTYDIIEDTVANQIRIVGFMDDGDDFILKYNPDTFVVTFDTQETGYLNPDYNNTMVIIRPASDATKISTFNPCTRKLTLYMDYYMNGVGGWLNKSEVFSGI